MPKQYKPEIATKPAARVRAEIHSDHGRLNLERSLGIARVVSSLPLCPSHRAPS